MYLSQITPAMMLAQLTQDPAAFFTLVHAALPALRESRGSVVAVTTAATPAASVARRALRRPEGPVEALARAFAVEEDGTASGQLRGPGMLTAGMSAELIGSGQLDEHALEVAWQSATDSATPRHRRGRLLPRLRPARFVTDRSSTWTGLRGMTASSGFRYVDLQERSLTLDRAAQT